MRGFHELNFSEEFGPAAFITRARREGLRDFGACMSPATAFQILQGIETLPLRMQKHVENTSAIVDFLEEDENVEWLNHPMLSRTLTMSWPKQFFRKGVGRYLALELKEAEKLVLSLSKTLTYFHI